jgi:hypothetical protein
MPTFSGRRLYLQFTWEVTLPPSPVFFLPPPLLQAFPLLVAGQVLPLLPSPDSLFIYSSMKDGPSPPSALRHPALLLCVFFIVVVAYYSVFFLFFPWVGVSLSRELC